MPAIVVNALLALLFVFSNYSIWDYVKSTTGIVQLVQFGPIWIGAVPLGGLVNGELIPVSEAKVPLFNLPFWLFFFVIALNMYFIVKLAMNKSAS